MSDEAKMFTLDEAKVELARRECRESGHTWSVIEDRTFADPAGEPTHVVCSRCGASRRVEAAS